MMAKKQKFFKNLLASSAIASVVASLGSSNVALAAAPAVRGAIIVNNAALTDGGGNVNWDGITQAGQPTRAGYDVNAVWGGLNPELAITYGGNYTLNADQAGATITAINLAHNNPGILTVNQNLSIGSIVSTDANGNNPTNEKLPITIAAGHTATLTGTDAAIAQHGFDVAAPNTYTGLGDVTLADAGSTLVVHSANNGDIAFGNVLAGMNQQGVLTFETGGSVGTIGATARRLATVNIGYAGGPATVTLNGDVHANNTNLAHANSILNVEDGKKIFDNITTGAGGTGTLTFLRAGTVTGRIGANNALAEVNFGIAVGQPNAGGGAVELRGAANATHFNINHAAANVTAKGLMTGTVKFNADGTLTANVGITGAVDFLGHAGTITLGDGQTITGAVDNTNGAGAAAVAAAGILNFAGAGTVTQAIGATKALAEVNFGIAGVRGGAVELRGAATATDFNINHAAANVTARGLMTGKVNFNAAGTLNADLGIMGDVDFLGNNGTITLENAQRIQGAVDNTDGAGGAAGADAGILNFAGAGEVTGAIGATKALTAVNFNGAGNVHLRQAAAAQTFTFNGVATLHAHNNITGNVHFNRNNGTIKLADGKAIDGSITTQGSGEGILTFDGDGEVTGDIGAINANPALNRLIHQISINAAGKDVILRKNVYTEELNFVAASTVKIGGSFVGEVNFNAGGMLEFNGADHVDPITGVVTKIPRFFNSTIQGGANGTLNVNTSVLIANNVEIGEIDIINIGMVGGNAKALAINASAADANLLNGTNINFMHANSMLGLFTRGRDSIVTFHGNLPGGVSNGAGGLVGNGGIVWLDGDDTTPGYTLTVQSATGAETLGTVANKLGELRISRRVTIAGEAVNKLDVKNANALNIINGAIFTDNSATSAKIANIHIGAASADVPTPAGPANYILDAKHGVFNLNATKADQITFDHADAQLTLRNSAAADKTITLVNNLNPGADGKGIVELDSVVDGKTLTIAGGGKSLGIVGNNLKKVIFSGAGKFDTRQITIHSKNIELNVNELTLGAVNSNILFAKNTVLTANGDITGNVDFQNHDGTVRLAANKNINGSIIGGANGTLEFLGIGTVTGPITNLKLLKAGAGNVTLAGFNHNITEIQGNDVVGNLIFTNNSSLTGSINSTGGKAVGLTFQSNNSVTGVVGTATSPVGTIQVQGTTVFSDKVQTANDQDIIISNNATAEFANTVTTRDIKGAADGQGTVTFNNTTPITINSTIGAGNSVDTLNIAGKDVEITQAVSASNINFSNTQEATLTLRGTSTVGSIRTVGNNVHTLELAADFTTRDQYIGLENNRLKSIKLLGDHKITINSGLYSDVSTKTNNTGKVIFNSDRSFAYNLGTNDLRLSDVTFANNATVKGDVYSKQITIASDKTATFAGTKNRTISVPNFTVDGSSLSRLLKSFAYSTQIVSDEIKNEGIAKFDKAVLVDAKITGGKVIFADNVWFKQTADGKEVNFAANKYVILEQNINFANIKADQAKIIILPKTASITGNLAAKDFTVDLAANQLKYTGQAQLTGKIELVTAYDTSSGAGGNIEVQKDSKLDLSKADELTIKVKAQTDINKIPKEEAKYVVISSVNGNGLVAIDNSKIKLDPTGEQNRFVQWSMDSSDLKLYITDISKEVIAKEIADKSTSQEEREFYIQLNNVTDRNSSAAQFMNNIGRMDREHALQAMDRILPGNEHPIGESLARNPTSEIIGGLMAQADTQITATRMGNSVPMQNAASAVDSENATSAIGSGDDDTLRYGVWGSPFYGTACQETYKGVSGYKSKSAGGIVGFDGLVNDNLLLGAAYSRINTQMSHQDKKIGDKTNGKTNIFSLYSLYNLTNNWFTEAIASYGITRVRNSEGRLIATNVKRNATALETAAAKYKSISYSGQLLTGYNYIASEKLMITPTIGFRYSQFKDAGYTETSTKFQNLVVKKRSYNKFEGILGLRTAATLKANKVLLIPELHGYVNHDFKGKAPIIDARLDGINEPLPTKSVKPVKTFFTVGTGFTAKYNMMECGIIYNVNIASKYIGHQGSLKVKVNF